MVEGERTSSPNFKHHGYQTKLLALFFRQRVSTYGFVLTSHTQTFAQCLRRCGRHFGRDKDKQKAQTSYSSRTSAFHKMKWIGGWLLVKKRQQRDPSSHDKKTLCLKGDRLSTCRGVIALSCRGCVITSCMHSIPITFPFECFRSSLVL